LPIVVLQRILPGTKQGYTPCFERAKIVENGLCTNYLSEIVD